MPVGDGPFGGACGFSNLGVGRLWGSAGQHDLGKAGGIRQTKNGTDVAGILPVRAEQRDGVAARLPGNFLVA